MNAITTERPKTNSMGSVLDSLEGANLPLAMRGEFALAIDDYRNRRAAVATANDEQAAIDLLVAAERRALSFQASSISELRAIAEIIWSDEDSLPSSEMVTAFFASLCNLDKNPSPTFDPVRWLTDYEAGGGGWIERDDEIHFLSADTDASRLAMWELKTRNGAEQVKAIIRNRTAPDTNWGQLVSNYETAKARLDEYQSVERNLAMGTPENAAHEAKIDELADAHFDAALALLSSPAPDAKAYAYKMQAYHDAEAFQWSRNHEVTKDLVDDAKRLAA